MLKVLISLLLACRALGSSAVNSSAAETPLYTNPIFFGPQSDYVYSPQKRALARQLDTSVGGDVGVGVGLPSIGLSLGNITTKLGNINVTVSNITIATGDINVENISIGNISVIVKIPLPGASPVKAFSAYTGATSIASSTAAPTSTVSSTSVSSAAATSTGVRRLQVKRQDATQTTLIPTPTSDTNVSVGASATVTGGPINAGVGNVYTEIGNITINVNSVNVSIGSVTIKNVSIGNIFIYVEVGQPDLSSLANAIGDTASTVGTALPTP